MPKRKRKPVSDVLASPNPPSTWSLFRWGLFAFLVIATAVVAFLFWHRQSDKPGPKTEPLVPLAETLARQEQEAGDLANQAHAELYRLINTHSDINVRGGLKYLLKNEILRLNFEAAGEYSDPVRGSSILAAVFVARKSGQGFEYINPAADNLSQDTLAVIMNINPRRLLDQSTTDWYKQEFITHEYTHLVQLFSGRYRQELFFFYEAGAVPIDSSFVAELFEAEAQAHYSQALLAVSGGNPEEVPVCAAFARGGYIALRRKLAEIFLENRLMQPYREIINRLAVNPPPGAEQPPDLYLHIKLDRTK